MAVNGRYPEDYPEDFENKLIEAGAAQKEVRKVYRILYDGKFAAENFNSSFQDYNKRGRPLTRRQREKLGTYSTSVFQDIKEAEYVKMVAMRNPPNARIVVGTIASHTGYNQRTIEREPTEFETHYDWWIFNTVDKEKEILPCFTLMEEGEDESEKGKTV